MLRDANGVLHIVPNSQVTTVSNMTAPGRGRWWTSGCVRHRRRQGTRGLSGRGQSFAKDEHWASRFDGDPEVVGVNSLDESQITIRTQFRTHAGQQWAVGREFRRRILSRLAREGNRDSVPRRSVNLRIADASARQGDGAGWQW